MKIRPKLLPVVVFYIVQFFERGRMKSLMFRWMFAAVFPLLGTLTSKVCGENVAPRQSAPDTFLGRDLWDEIESYFSENTIKASILENLDTMSWNAQGIPFLDSIFSRLLQAKPTRTCGEVISKVTINEIRQVGEVFVDVLIPNGTVPQVLVDAVKATVFGILQYNFTAVKVCLSCANVTVDMIGSSAWQNGNEYGFQTYCGPDKYAYEAVSL